MAKAIEIKRLNKWFGSYQALKDIDLNVSHGERIVICGPSGSGKSTLIRCINSLEHHDSGEITVDDIELNQNKASIAAIGAEVGMVFQQFNLFPHLSVLQNLTLGPTKVRGLSRSDAEERAMRILERVQIPEQAHKQPSELSGGQQQRVALVRALATRPSLLLLDEPLSHLDPELRDSVRTELLKLFRETDTTALFVSHDIEDAMAMADRMVVLRKATAEQVGTQLEIYDRPANPHVARLFGKTNFIPLGLLPDAPHSIAAETGEGQVVPARPHQWQLVENSNDGSTAFTGKVVSTTNRGAHQEVLLQTENLTLTIHFPGNTTVKPGETLTVSCDLTV